MGGFDTITAKYIYDMVVEKQCLSQCKTDALLER